MPEQRLGFCISTAWHGFCFQVRLPGLTVIKNGQSWSQGPKMDLCAFTLGTGPSLQCSSVLLCTDDRE